MLVIQMRNVDKLSTVLNMNKNSDYADK